VEVKHSGLHTIYAENVRICKEITQELGFTNVQKLQEGMQHVAENQEEAQKFINLAIKDALKQKCKSAAELERRLKDKGIECKFTVEEGEIKYSSYM
jgi:vacuolar-type H+-ATPase catalytic subunit A/Vma1